MDLITLSWVLAIAGLACFIWPLLQRLQSGGAANDNARPSAIGVWLRGAGFVLTVLALIVQRMGTPAG